MNEDDQTERVDASHEKALKVDQHGGELKISKIFSICTGPATAREHIAYGSQLRRPETVHADPEAMQARLVRSRLA